MRNLVFLSSSKIFHLNLRSLLGNISCYHSSETRCMPIVCITTRVVILISGTRDGVVVTTSADYRGGSPVRRPIK